MRKNESYTEPRPILLNVDLIDRPTHKRQCSVYFPYKIQSKKSKYDVFLTIEE